MASNSIAPNHSAEKKQPGLLDRVRATIDQHQLLTHGSHVVVGVSGGPDSLTLLHCLRALRSEFKCTVHAAHLNHQLRGADSDADAEFVQAIVREWQLPATLEARDVPAFAQAHRLSIEEAARRARYLFLAQIAQREGASLVAVAHHRDDQVETLLMHFLRGTGLAGLRGMKHKTPLRGAGFGLDDAFDPLGLALVRPLLDVTRAEIDEYARAHDLAPRLDRSNFEPTYFRNRLRYNVIPFLEAVNPALREAIYRTSLSISDDYDFLDAVVEAELEKIARAEQGAIVFARAAWRALHPALQRGTLRQAIRRLRGDVRNIGWTHIEEARRIALEKTAGAEATLPNGLLLVVGYGEFVIADAVRSVPLPDLPLLHADNLPLDAQGICDLPGTDWLVETSVSSRMPETTDRWTAVLDLGMCRGERFLRRRRAGDRFQPAGMQGHTRSLHEFMIDEKVQRTVRARLPLLVVGDRIVWVCGLRVDERARVTPLTREFWRVAFRKSRRYQVSPQGRNLVSNHLEQYCNSLHPVPKFPCAAISSSSPAPSSGR